MVLRISRQEALDNTTASQEAMFYYLSSGKSFRDTVHDVKGITSDILYEYISKLIHCKSVEWKLNDDEVRLFDGFSKSQVAEVVLKSFYEPERAVSLWEISSMANIPMDVFMSGSALDKQTRLKLLSTQEMMQRHHMYYNGLTTNRVIDYSAMDPFKFIGYDNYTVYNHRLTFV